MHNVKQYYDDDKTLEHVIRVVELCETFIKNGACVNKNLLLDAAILHDLSKYIGNDYHQERKYIALALNKKNIDIDKINKFDDICIIIENHRGEFFPHRYLLESAVLRTCDKLDKFNKAIEKSELAYEKAKRKAKEKKKTTKKAEEKAEKKREEVYKNKKKEAKKSCKKSMGKIIYFFDNLSDEDNLSKENLINFKNTYQMLFDCYNRIKR